MSMTLEQVRDWHLDRTNYVHLPITNKAHKEMADAITAHLTQPAQSVDVAKVREVIASIDLRAETYLDPQCKAWANKLTAALQEKGNG